jgi:chemotaxis protein MotB
MAVKTVAQLQKELKELEASARRKDGPSKPPEAHDESNWLVSYADMMTLLCGFFIMLFSMATLEKPRYEKARQEVQKHFKEQLGLSPAKGPSQAHEGVVSAPTAAQAPPIVQEKPLDERIHDRVEQIIIDNKLEEFAGVRQDKQSITVVFESQVFFDTLSAFLTEDGRQVLEKLAEGIRSELTKAGDSPAPFKFVIEGHTDSRPILSGSFPSNWELSSARAASVLRIFLNQGFSAQQMLAIGYADTRPLAPERTPAGLLDDQALSKNRRVVIRILNPSAEQIPWASESANSAR